MKVEIWSDVACPWCYIGKRRFETALKEFPHRDHVEIVWRSFELNPDAPRDQNEKMDVILAKKYNVSVAQARSMNDRVTTIAAQEGLEYHMDQLRYGNSFDAHRLSHLAANHGLQDAMEERLFKAYFTDGMALGDPAALSQLAVEVGLDADEVSKVLAGDTYSDAVRADEQLAHEYGIQGVPFFAIDDTYGISGGQPSEVFLSALNQAWAESQPPAKTVSADESDPSDDNGMCEDGVCKI